jgi:CitMHS family citrate-Mg2+:H+ or citrate-Ca2+:H+ symporter
MLTLLGFLMVVTFMTLIMTKRMAPLVALIIVPVAFGLIAGFGTGLGPMMLSGVQKIAPTGVLLMFAILYFGLMIDSGLFDPIVVGLLKAVKGDPVKILVGTVLLCALVSLDGDGSTAYMITAAAMLPLYKRLRLNPLMMICLMMVTSGVMNILPWGGPTARVASALQIDVDKVFVPMIPAMIAGIAALVAIAWLFGRAERRRLGVLTLRIPCDDGVPPLAVDSGIDDMTATDGGEITVSTEPAARRPKLLWFNGLLTVALVVLLTIGLLPLPVLFMCGFAIAAVANYPRVDDLRARVAAHAPNAMAVVALIFAAGIFTGILSGTGMVEAMSKSLVSVIPASMGPHMVAITAALSLPLTFFISNDAFYFGVVPVLAQAGAHYGIGKEAVAMASLIGQPVHLLSPLVPSTYLLVSLAGVDLGDHQKFTLKWAALVCLVLFAAAAATGCFA